MSLRSELPRSQPSRFNKRQARTALRQGPLGLSDNAVMTFPEWCAVNSISPRTGRRLIAAGDGPPVVRLSPRRIGVTIASDRSWKASRERA
jgi:hypothetical protein